MSCLSHLTGKLQYHYFGEGVFHEKLIETTLVDYSILHPFARFVGSTRNETTLICRTVVWG